MFLWSIACQGMREVGLQRYRWSTKRVLCPIGCYHQNKKKQKPEFFKVNQKIKKTIYFFRKYGETPYFRLFFEYFWIFWKFRFLILFWIFWKYQKPEFFQVNQQIKKTIYFFRNYGGPPYFRLFFWFFGLPWKIQVLVFYVFLICILNIGW